MPPNQTASATGNVPPEIARAEGFFAAMLAQTADAPGVTRATYGPGEQAAHDLAAAWAAELDLEVEKDAAGNQYMSLPGQDRGAPVVVVGSHMDSVPHGGNYDGAAGVVMGLAALQRFRETGFVPAQDIRVMAIRAEESGWFGTHYGGSRMAFGVLPPDEFAKRKRFDTGRTLADHMAEVGCDVEAIRAGAHHLDPAGIRCYLEPHIEQGPALVAAGVPVGIVTAIRGNLRYQNCTVTGVHDHAGAVPREQRHDAVFAATEFAQSLERRWLELEAAGIDLVCTIGVFETDRDQHTLNKIPGFVHFTMDLRSEDNQVLMDLDAWLRNEAERIAAARNVTIELGGYANALPATMDPGLRAVLQAKARDLGIAHRDIASGAGHDCATFADQGVPSAMIFIRNENGSHNPNEAMEMEDFAEATRLLIACLEELG